MAVNKTASGKWEASHRGPDGRERQRTFATKVLAQRWEQSSRTDVQRGEWFDERGGTITVKDLSLMWLRTQSHLAPSTYARYENVVGVHIIPVLGRRQVGQLTYVEAQAFISTVTATRAPATAHKVHQVLSLMLELAVKDDRVKRNVARDINLRKVPPSKHRYLNHLELSRLVGELGERDALIFLVLGYCGLRWGELAALRVSDFDPLRRRIAIERSVTLVRGHFVWGAPKDNEHRSVPVPAFLVDLLVPFCAGREKDELLFPGARCTPLRVNSWRQSCFDQAAASAGLEGLHPHELRHTAASLAVSAGANVKALQTHARAQQGEHDLGCLQRPVPRRPGQCRRGTTCRPGKKSRGLFADFRLRSGPVRG